MKVLTVVGARPQFVKAAVVSRAFQAFNKKNEADPVQEILVHTGQHYDANMSEVFFQEMHIPTPDYNLGIGGSTHGAMTGRMLEKIEEIMMQEKPDIVLVYGDTNSTLAGALAAVKLHIPVAHVEAGLRSFNMRMPEEVNRILTDRVSNWLFCPTGTAVQNLQKEGFELNGPDTGAGAGNPAIIANVGDVMYDAALYYKQIAHPSEAVAKLLEQSAGGFYLATVHRAENTDDPGRLQNIMRALDQIAADTPVVFPAHPRTRKILESRQMLPRHMHLIDPVGYFDMISLLSGCNGVFTDSGGVQKEAYFFQKPCITLRDETEWVELVENGFNTLAGAEFAQIIEAEAVIRRQSRDYAKVLYGTGDAGQKIVAILTQ